MKKLPLLLFLLMFQNFFAQVFRYEKTEKKDAQNITIEKISEDQLHSTYLITILNHVPLHFHKDHSENIIVLEGEAIMKIDSDHNLLVLKGSVPGKPGSLVNIRPANIVGLNSAKGGNK